MILGGVRGVSLNFTGIVALIVRFRPILPGFRAPECQESFLSLPPLRQPALLPIAVLGSKKLLCPSKLLGHV